MRPDFARLYKDIALLLISHRLQDLHRKGHEIGVFSVTRRDEAEYWSEGSYDDWLAEMAGARNGYFHLPHLSIIDEA